MRTKTPFDKRFVGKAYNRFLELPVTLVLAVFWFLGATLIGLCLLALYMLYHYVK